MDYIDSKGIKHLWARIGENFSSKSHNHTWSQISDRPGSLPAAGGISNKVYDTNGTTPISFTYSSGGNNNPLYFAVWNNYNVTYCGTDRVKELINTDTWRPITTAWNGDSTTTSVSQSATKALYNSLVNGYANSAGSTNYINSTDGLNSTISNQTLSFCSTIPKDTQGLFTTTDNSNAIIRLNRHPGSYDSQIGFNAGGRIFYRSSDSNDIFASGWNTLAYTSDIPSSLPASDVYGWAKAASKPSYSWDEIGSKPATATRWPSWGEVSGKPGSMPASDVYGWAKAASKPSYSWDEISSKPAIGIQKIYRSIYINGSINNFYPVTFWSTHLELDCEIHSPCLGGGEPYNQNQIHFLLTSQGWSDTPKSLKILSYGIYDGNEITIGSIGVGLQSGMNCIWLRGGLTYEIISNQSPIVRLSNLTTGGETFTVGTGFSGSGNNTNVQSLWTPTSRNYEVAIKADIPTVYDSTQCVTYTTDSGACTPAAVKKAFTIFDPKTHSHSQYLTSHQSLANVMPLHPNNIILTPASGNFGAKIDFASNDQGFAYIHEDSSDHLRIHGNQGVNLTAADPSKVTINGKKIATTDIAWLTSDQVPATFVKDYGDPSKNISIGYAGNGITSANATHFAAYTASGTKIKDLSFSEAAVIIRNQASGSWGINITGWAGAASYIGDGGMSLYANNSNEVNFGGTNASGEIYFGYRATGSKPIPSKFIFGGASGTATIVAGEVTATSDRRLKSDIKDLKDRGPLKPKTYIKDGKESIGFIAQEVQELYPELVTGKETDTEYLSLNYAQLTAVLAAQVNNLKKENEILKHKLEKVDKLEKEIELLKQSIK